MTCNRKLAKGQYWTFCGETDMGQSMPALCTECGGKFKLTDPDTGELTYIGVEPFSGTIRAHTGSPYAEERKVAQALIALGDPGESYVLNESVDMDTHPGFLLPITHDEARALLTVLYHVSGDRLLGMRKRLLNYGVKRHA